MKQIIRTGGLMFISVIICMIFASIMVASDFSEMLNVLICLITSLYLQSTQLQLLLNLQ
jgi:hypothetical protein